MVIDHGFIILSIVIGREGSNRNGHVESARKENLANITDGCI